MTSIRQPGAFHALLIGVDHYMPPPTDFKGKGVYKSLSGCVHDVERMEDFLLRRMEVPRQRIRKLTASKPLSERSADQPTYFNMVRAFQDLCATAQTGDQVLIHYSGHGGRTPTHYPDLKGPGSKDEGLVPTDISHKGSQYLRDLELGFLLEKMVRKGLFVTLVMDCCHSGGATREQESTVPGAVARGNHVEDWERPGSSLVASPEELAKSWHRMRASRLTKRVEFGQYEETSGWLTGGNGYVLLAACRETELAYEYSVGPGKRGGALTHWLFDTLENFCQELPAPCNFTYKQLHDRVRAEVHSLFPQQMPQLEGDSDRRLFQAESSVIAHSINVLAAKDNHLLLNTGQAQAVRGGARFAVFPPGWNAGDVPEKRLAVVEVDQLGGAESWARIIDKSSRGAIKPGAQALPLDLGKIRLRRTVRLDVNDESRGRDQAVHKALDTVRQSLVERGSAFLELVSEESAAEHQVIVNRASEYEIRDAMGEPLPNLRPILAVGDSNSALKLVERLVHLARFRNVEELVNADSRSPLFGKLQIELGYLPADFDLGDVMKPKPMTGLGESAGMKCAEVQVGDWLCLTIKNLSQQALNLTVLDLKPRWDIQQIYPTDGDFLVLDAGGMERFPMQVDLPPAMTSGIDVLKVFATIDATQFRWLELPPLDAPIPQTKGEITNPLEELMAAMADDGPQSKDMTVRSYASREWNVEQIAVKVRSQDS